jgi:hypothetical protein
VRFLADRGRPAWIAGAVTGPTDGSGQVTLVGEHT